MAVQLLEPASRLPMLMQPATPPYTQHITWGYRHDKQGNWALTNYGRRSAAVAQRILLRYVLGYETRAELAQRYSLSEREIQAIVTGERTHWFTDPVRERLMLNGIGNARMNRSDARAAEVRRALEHHAALATSVLRWPKRYSVEQRREIYTDLYLLSGAWRSDEQ